MKSLLSSFLLSTTMLVAAAPVFAQAAGDKKAAPQNESALIAKARAEYPLKTCLVSDENLGSMGEATAYVHRAPGKPDRVVFFCCEGCTDDFKADPAKYLKKVDDAASKKGASGKKEKAK
jgi:YHS domain-containing protein